MWLDEAIEALNIVRDFIPASHPNRPGLRLRARHITIHNTDNRNPGADATAHGRYLKGAEAQAREVSWHYTVDDGKVVQSLPVGEIGWHAGPGNRTSFGIEICMHEGMDETSAYRRAALLVAVLAHKHGIAVPQGIRQHYDWTGKPCPSVLRASADGWSEFLQQVQSLHRELRVRRRRRKPAGKPQRTAKSQRPAQTGGRRSSKGP